MPPDPWQRQDEVLMANRALAARLADALLAESARLGAMNRRSFIAPTASALGATALSLLYRGAPTAFDEWLASITLETARPGPYATGDVLVSGEPQRPISPVQACERAVDVRDRR
jgi:hypothetical protein